VLAASILAEIGDVHRIPRLAASVDSAGLNLGVASGTFPGARQHLSKRRSPYPRQALFLPAHTAHLRNPDLTAYLQCKPAEGNPARAAIVALAHRLMAHIYVVLTENWPSDVR
jgi:transposase